MFFQKWKNFGRSAKTQMDDLEFKKKKLGGPTTLQRRSVVQAPARRAVVQRGNVAECAWETPRRNVATPQRYPLVANGTQCLRE